MTIEIATFLLILAVGIILFVTDKFAPDMVALGMMLSLVITGLLPTEEAFAGFGSRTVMMILGLLIMTEGLTRTGMVEFIGQNIFRYMGNRPRALSLSLMVIPGFLSSFLSNTASTAFFLPITLGLAQRVKISPSKLLMPMAFASIMAGSVTLIGTSTNLVVSGMLEREGLKPIGVFELTPVGLPILVAGIIYMFTVGTRLIPDRSQVQQSSTDDTNGRPYFSEVIISPESPFIGKSIEETPIINELNLGVLRLYRDKSYIKPLAKTVLQPDDVLLVEGRREDILKISSTPNIEIRGAIEALETYQKGLDAQVAEVILLPGSQLIGRTIKGLRLRERYKIQILAITQEGKTTYSKLGRRTLQLGDVLLIQIPRENMQLLESERFFRVLDVLERPAEPDNRMWISTAIFVASIAVAALEILPIQVSVLVGSVLMYATGCISPDETYRKIEWRVLILIGSMLAFGQAMGDTGTADYLAEHILTVSGAATPATLLTVFFILAVLLTQLLSNQAAAAVLVPIAIQTAILSNFNPRPFAIMIALAASCSFITPLEPACVMIFGAGKYRFFDFTRVGFFLTILIYIITMTLVPVLWDF